MTKKYFIIATKLCVEDAVKKKETKTNVELYAFNA